MAQLLIELVDELTQAELERQHQHHLGLSTLDSLSDERRERYKYMARGSQMMLDILKTSSIGEQGIDAFLNKLSEPQLDHALSSLNRRLAERASQGKVELYCVKTSILELFFFRKADAKAAFIAAGEEEIARNAPYPEVKLDPVTVPFADVADYLGEHGEGWQDYFNANPDKIIKPK